MMDTIATLHTPLLKWPEQITLSYYACPPHTSHACQPLDVGVFKPMKDKWRQTLGDFYKNAENKVTKQTFPSLLAKVWTALKPENAVSAFRSSGLHPCDRRAVQKKIIPEPIDLSRPGTS